MLHYLYNMKMFKKLTICILIALKRVERPIEK